MQYSDIHTILKTNLMGQYPDREAESIGRLVSEHITGLGWIQIRLNSETELTLNQESEFSDIIKHLQNHEPIQYVLGETEFYGIRLKVRPGVLIPRGETEELVEWIIGAKSRGQRAEGRGQRAEGKEQRAEGKEQRAEGRGQRAEGRGQRAEGRGQRAEGWEQESREKKIRILDIGCGSGAIAIALAVHLPDAEIIAADISEDALRITGENAALNGQHITLLNYNILSPPSTCHPRENFIFDIIVSNPPYIPQSEKHLMEPHVVDYEPEIALFVPDDDPLLFYRAIAGFAASHLNPGGQVYVEINDQQGEETVSVFKKWFSEVELRKDIHGKDRMIRAYHG